MLKIILGLFCVAQVIWGGFGQETITPSQVQQFLDATKLNPEDVKKLAQTIKEIGPSISQLADHLQKVRRSISQGEEKGADWMFGSDPSAQPANQDNDQQNVKARDIGVNSINDLKHSSGLGDGILFQAKRFCGFSPKVDPARLSQAAPGQYPWAAAILLDDDSFLCSGTLISESIVLTTASCILKYRTRNEALKVVLGAWNVVDGHQILPELQVVVRAAVLHPSFSPDNPQTFNHNIGLLRLSENVDFDLYPHVFPVCIISPSSEKSVGTNFCQVLGWPGLPEMQHWRSRSYLGIGDVTAQTNECPAGISSCAVGRVCIGNEGSSINCLANSQRFYQWGILLAAPAPNCDRQATASLSVVTISDNYDFLQKYIWTPNHAIN